MFIRDVDEGLEKLLRERLPLPEHIGDISFDPPTGTWSAQLSRLTVNLFLYHLDRSSQPTPCAAAPLRRQRPPERRGAQPMIELGYLVSAWAGSPRDEHQLLGDVTSLLAGLANLPPEYRTPALNSTVMLAFGTDDFTRPRDVWQASTVSSSRAQCSRRPSRPTPGSGRTRRRPSIGSRCSARRSPRACPEPAGSARFRRRTAGGGVQGRGDRLPLLGRQFVLALAAGDRLGVDAGIGASGHRADRDAVTGSR